LTNTDALLDKVVEPLVKGKANGDAIRVWSAGTSTGEEAYSLAMMFLEAFERAKKWPQFKVFATDVEQANVDLASAGVYPASIEAEIRPELVEKYFLRRGDQLHVRPDLRQAIVFARHNLLADPPFTRLDLATCRNVLIYFKPAAQDRALRKLQYSLRMGGYLFLGSSESLGASNDDFATISQRKKIWRKERESQMPVRDLASRSSPLDGYDVRAASRPVTVGKVAKSAIEMGHKSLLDGFGPPPAVLVNAKHEIIHSYGKVDRYLKVREGAARLDLNRMLPKALVPSRQRSCSSFRAPGNGPPRTPFASWTKMANGSAYVCMPCPPAKRMARPSGCSCSRRRRPTGSMRLRSTMCPSTMR
jgi:two-component system CheB/CheR fusion protein